MGIGYGENSIKIYDFDKLEEANCAGGIFRESDSSKGIFKVNAIKDFIATINEANIEAYAERYLSQPIEDEVVILCIDSVSERLRIVDYIVSNYPNVKLIIDTRSGWHQGQVFLLDTTDKKQLKKWKATLDPSTIEELPCGAKAVAYNPVTIAGFVGSQLRNYFNSQQVPKEFLVLHSASLYEVKLK